MKKILLIIYCISRGLLVNAQTPITNWQYEVGDNTGNEQIRASAYDADGNLYIAGHFYGTIDLDLGEGQTLLGAAGSYDGFLAKYNSFGQILWAMRLGGSDAESINSIHVDGSYVYVAGYFQGTMNIYAPNITVPLVSVSNSADIFMARFTTNGLHVNSYKIGMAGNDNAKFIKTDNAGNIYLAGIYSSPNNNTNVNFNVLGGANNLLSTGAEDGFIAKYNSSFVLQWVKSYGVGVTNDAVLSLDIDNNQNVYAAGTFGGTNAGFNNGFFLTSSGSIDGFIAKINSTGNTIWAKKIGGGNSDNIINLKLDGKGAIFIGGNFIGTANLNPNGTAQNFTAVGGDAFVSKLDTNLGTALWIKPFGGSGYDYLYGLTLDTIGNVYTTGYFIGSAEFPVGITASVLNSGSAKDIFVSKLNTSGTFIWSKSLGGLLEEEAYSISITPNGDFGYITGTNIGNGTGYLAKIGKCAEVGNIVGLTKLCSNSSVTYRVDSVPGATNYVWNLPAGWAGTSNTRSILVTPNSSGGVISVNSVTACGAGFARQLSINYGTTTIDNNLVRYWLANDNDGNKDIKNNYGLTLVNTVKDTGRFSTANSAYRISSNAGFIQLQPTANLSTGPATIAFWYYYQNNGGANNVLIGSNATALPAGQPLLLTDNASSKIYPYSSTGLIGSGVQIVQNTWTHIALSRSGANFSLFVNGALAYSGNTLNLSNFDRIGNNRPGFELQGATGKFDDIRIYDGNLSEVQMKNIYNYSSIKASSFNILPCKNEPILLNVLSSDSTAKYVWKLNGAIVGSNLPTYSKFAAINDTSISVSINSQCFEETISKHFTINIPDSVRIITTNCGIKVGNKTYSVTGNYVDTLVNRFGCDSIVYVNLTVNNNLFANLSSNLIRYWTANEQDTAKDLTNAFVLSKSFGVLYTTDRFGNSNSALAVPTISGQEIAPALALPATNLTISFWFKNLINISGITRGLLNGSSTASSTSYLYINPAESLMVNNSSGTAAVVPVQLVSHNWYHFTFSLSSTGVAKVYVNGELKLTNSNMSLAGITRFARGIAANSQGVGNYDDIKVYNAVLSDEEVLLVYNRPSIISRPLGSSACQNSTKLFSYKINGMGSNTYQFVKNGSIVDTDTNYTISSMNLTDTLISFKVYSQCGYEEFKTKMTIQPTVIITIDSFCGSYINNSKTYTAAGIYYDTIPNLNGCSVINQLNLSLKSGTNIGANLTHYFTLNNLDSANIKGISAGISIPLSASTVIGRTNIAATSRSISAIGQKMVLPTLPSSNITVSLWYMRNISSYTGARTIIGNTQANGNIAKMLYVSPSGFLFIGNSASSTGVQTSASLTANIWYHLVYQLAANGEVKLFVNGILVETVYGVPLNSVSLIGNRNDGNEPGMGSYDDIKIYNSLLSANEILTTYSFPSAINMPSKLQVCQGSNNQLTYHFTGNSSTTYQIKKNGIVLSNDSFLQVNNIALSDTSFDVLVRNGCVYEQYATKIEIDPANGIGATLSYNKNNSRITAVSSFSRYKLFRNGIAIDSSNTTGSINYSTNLCGNYFAEFSNSSSANCPASSSILNIGIDTVIINAKICNGKNYLFNNQLLVNSGVYFKTITNTNNCDSIIKLNLSVANATNANFSRVGCGSLVINGKTYTQTGQYKDTLINSAGCDSIITLNLTVNSGIPSINNISLTACNSLVLNGKTYQNSGIYRDTLFGANSNGCDSIMVLNLTFNKNGSTLALVACKNYVFKGITITQSGTYYDTLTNVLGCDSIITLNLTINNIDKTVTKMGNTLTSVQAGSVYQWINCATNLPIPNANSQSYTATLSGDYKVVITKNNCVDTSVCVNIVVNNCNLYLGYTVMNPTDTIRCNKSVKVAMSHVVLPVNLKLFWVGNPNGIVINKMDSVHTYIGLCPETYKVIATDANGCNDSVVFTILEPTTRVDNMEINTFNLHPNPASNTLIISNLYGKSSLVISDLIGREIYTENVTNSELEINTTNWEDGMYLIKIENNGKTAVKRLIIRK